MSDSHLPLCTVCCRAMVAGGLYCGIDRCLRPPAGMDSLGYSVNMIRYEGYDTDGMGGRVVSISPTRQKIPLRLRLDLAPHSPTGFSWGYAGSGPAQLALAILADLWPDHIPWVKHHYQEFKRKVIAHFPQGEDWTLTKEQIVEAIGEPASHNSPDEMSHNSEGPDAEPRPTS